STATSPSSAVSVPPTPVPPTADAPSLSAPTSVPAPPTSVTARTVPVSPATPGGARPAPLGPGAAPVLILVVAPGDSFWSLAREVADAEFGRSAPSADIGLVWRALVRANVSHLADPRNPNLIYSGQVFSVP